MRYSRLAMTMIQFTGASTPEPLVEVSNSRLEELSDEESSPADVVVGLLKVVWGSVVRVGEVVSELLQTPGVSTPHEFHKL